MLKKWLYGKAEYIIACCNYKQQRVNLVLSALLLILIPNKGVESDFQLIFLFHIPFNFSVRLCTFIQMNHMHFTGQ